MIYGIGMMLSRAVSFLMLPIYTRYLTTADYGVLQLLDMTLDISYILFTAGMTAGLGLFYYQTHSQQERADLVRTAFALEMGLTLLGSTALLLAAPLVWDYGLRGAGTTELVRITAINFFLQMLAAVPSFLLLIQQRSGAIITINLVRLLLQVSLNIFFVVGLREGVRGILFTGLIVNSIHGIGLSIWMLRTMRGRIRMEIVRRLRRFGLPFQVSAAGSFILSFGDRFFLQSSRGASAVGLYGLAYQFGFLLHQLSTEQVLKAWNPQRLQLLNEPEEERNARYARGFHYFNLVLITVATGIGVFVRPVIEIMTTAPFHPAARIVPIILAAYVIQSWGEATQFGIGVSQKTKYYSYATWAAVLVVLVLYATLIPWLGGYGAALATLAAFIVRFALNYRWSQRLWPVRYVWGPNLRLTLYGVGAVAAAYASPAENIALELGLGVVLITAYAALSWVTVLNSEDRRLFAGIARSPRQFASVFRA